MACLFWLALSAWVVVVAYMAPAVWAIYLSRGRRGDPARLVCLLFALLSIAGLARRILLKDTAWDTPLAVILLGHIGVAAVTVFTARVYGRGSRV